MMFVRKIVLPLVRFFWVITLGGQLPTGYFINASPSHIWGWGSHSWGSVQFSALSNWHRKNLALDEMKKTECYLVPAKAATS